MTWLGNPFGSALRRGRGVRPALISALLSSALLVGGCETGPFAAAKNANGSAANAPLVANPPPPRPFPPKPAIKATTKQAEMIVGSETPEPIAKPPVTTLTESQIVGAQSAQVRTLIGQPERVVTSAPSQTWHYASGPCRFSVQFFKDLDSGQYRALKYDVVGGSLERCLAQFERLYDAAPIEAQSGIKDTSAAAPPTSG